MAGCLNFAKSHFAIPDSGIACLWQNFSDLLSILPPRQNNLAATVTTAVAADDEITSPGSFNTESTPKYIVHKYIRESVGWHREINKSCYRRVCP